MINQEKEYDFIKYEDGKLSIIVKISRVDNTVWLTQKDIASLFETTRQNIGLHIKNIIDEGVLNSSVCKFFLPTASDGKTYKTKIYNLDMIVEIGNRIDSNRTKRFREWSVNVLNEEKIKYPQISQIILFKYNELSLDVTVSPDEETVWLTQNDIALLFETSKQNISFHIKNILSENELDDSVVKYYLTTANDGKTYETKMYNLDMIIAVGYRVNSKRGTIFRKWANNVLKQYLLKGYVVNEERCLACTSNIISLQNKVDDIESHIRSIEEKVDIERSKIFYQGEILDAYTFIRKLFY